jgi:hypothetical protein
MMANKARTNQQNSKNRTGCGRTNVCLHFCRKDGMMWLQVLIIAYYYRIDLNGTCPGCLDAFAAAGTFR